MNIRIHVRDKQLEEINLDSLQLTEEEKSDEFFSQPLAEVILDVAGVSRELSYLCKERSIGRWHATTCVNCQMHSYAEDASQQGTGRIYVNASLLDQTQQDEIRQHLSPAFKILLKNESQSVPKTLPQVQGSSPILDNALPTINRCLTGYLHAEETNMEQRIRQFKENEMQRFADLQTRTARDKTTLLCRLLEVTKEMTQLDAGDSKRVHLTELSEQSSLPTDEAAAMPRQQPETVTVKASKSRPVERRPVQQPSKDIETHDVFTLDLAETAEEDDRLFYESDDEDDGDISNDDSSSGHGTDQEAVGTVAVPQRLRKPQQVAHSMPMKMPTWHPQPVNIAANTEGNVAALENPEDVGASIMALAQSVRMEPRDVFGELPRPRLPSYTGSRPNVKK